MATTILQRNELQRNMLLKSLKLLHQPGDVVELRILGMDRAGTVSGYFNNYDNLVDSVLRYDGKASGIYATLNPVSPALLARASNKVVERSRVATSDKDIARRCWLPIDFDPVRPSEISSTDGEHEAALSMAADVKMWLTGMGWPDPIEADSGNGGHLLYAIDLPNDQESRELVKRCLEAVSAFFTNGQVEVDVTPHNAARIWKLYGTHACKGDDVPERPHRLAQVLSAPGKLEAVPLEQLQALARLLPEKPRQTARMGENEPRFDLSKWIDDHGLSVEQEKPWNGGRLWILNPCPFGSDHTNRSAFIAQFPNGAITAGCHHNGCQGKGWHDLRDMLEPGWRAKRDDGSPGDKANGKVKQADILLKLAEVLTLFNSEQEAFAELPVDNHREIWPVKHKMFRRWLSRVYHNEKGTALGNDSITQALNVIEARALFDSPEHKLHIRIAKHEDALWYDLADSAWRAVKIDHSGWEIVDEPPILFRRYKNTAPQVMPERLAGQANPASRLYDFVNIPGDDDKSLFLIYMISCLVPGIPHHISVFSGEQGSSKTTIQRIQRQLVDPANQEVCSFPDDKSELAIQLSHNHMPCFDNIDVLQPWQSDRLCCACTGGGITKRELYSDEDEVILKFLRCPSLNGINLVVNRSDLIDRALIFNLERITEETRREEAEFWASFREARPHILGGMFTALSDAMRIYPTVSLKRLPRMADFCRWGYAIAEALSIGGEEFLSIYYSNIRLANDEAISASPIASAVVAFMNGKRTWIGTPDELLRDLTQVAGESRIDMRASTWPKAANALTKRLNQVKTNLQGCGIGVLIGRSHHGRTVTLTAIEGAGKTVATGSTVTSQTPQGPPVGCADNVPDGTVTELSP